MLVCAEKLEDVSMKEMQLVGISSGSRVASGGNDFMQGGAEIESTEIFIYICI